MSKKCDCGFYDKRRRHKCTLDIQMGPSRKRVPKEYRRKEGAHTVLTKYRRRTKHGNNLGELSV